MFGDIQTFNFLFTNTTGAELSHIGCIFSYTYQLAMELLMEVIMLSKDVANETLDGSLVFISSWIIFIYLFKYFIICVYGLGFSSNLMFSYGSIVGLLSWFGLWIFSFIMAYNQYASNNIFEFFLSYQKEEERKYNLPIKPLNLDDHRTSKASREPWVGEWVM